MEKHFRSVLHDIFCTTLESSGDADLMLNSGLSFAGWHVAEKLGIPALAMYLWPVTPSRYLPPTSGWIPPDWFPSGMYNYLATKLSNQFFFRLLLPLVNECRQDILDLSPMRARDYWPLDAPHGSTRIIYDYSEAVIPKPPDWGPNQQISGYWFLEDKVDYRPDEGLRIFLDSGPAPVYIGFGSMVDHELDRVDEIILEALEQTGQRAVVLGGWSGMAAGDLPEHILRIGNVPHAWLFPRMAAVVHHGGAGTTAAGLRAGVPGVVIPMFADQFFWGWRVQQLGAGPCPIPRKQLSVSRLADAIHAALENDLIRQSAADIGRRIRAEDGVGAVVKMIADYRNPGT